MQIRLSGREKGVPKITVRDLVSGYYDESEQEGAVVGYSGKLNIRPAFQRNFVYGEKERNLVVATVRQGFPLNVMYWAKIGDEQYEVIDGQQRTISICQYVGDITKAEIGEQGQYLSGEFSINWDGTPKKFNNLTHDQQKELLDYELSIYICEGTADEKITWFNVINIAGLEQTPQEIRNANYTGKWLMEAKRFFSKTGGPAVELGKNLVTGEANRQKILETALRWISRDYDNSHKGIEEYMADHQNAENADEIRDYYRTVVDWTNTVFPNQASNRVQLMKGLEWGKFYNKYKDESLNPQALEKRIIELIDDEEVENKRGIYEFILTGDERTLNLRIFDEKTKIKKYEEQKGICLAKNAVCGNVHFEFNDMDADHIKPWSRGGKTIYENCQMLCRQDNNIKSRK
jgi:hypothetical protein